MVGLEQPVGAVITAPLIQGVSGLVVDMPDEFIPGDLLRLNATDDGPLVNDWWGEGQTGQIVEVSAVHGDTLILARPLRRSYATLPVIIRVLPRRQVHLRCLGLLREDATTLQTVNVYFADALDCTMRGVSSKLSNYAHVDVFRSSRITVENCAFREGHGYGAGGKAFGLLVDFASGDCFIHQNTFEHLRHSMILQAGANGNVLAYNHSTDPFWSSFPFPANSAGDIVLHGNYPYMNLFEGNVVQNIVMDNSHNINGPYNTFFRNRAELYGIFMNTGPASNDQNFIGNQVSNSSGGQYGLYNLQGTGHFVHGNQVHGTIQPGGTGEPLAYSLFDYAFPSFYPVMSSIPPIRTDNWQATAPLVLAEYRKEVLGLPATCSDSIFEANTAVDPPAASSLDPRAYPDPVEDELIIEGTSLDLGIMRIVDALGKEVLQLRAYGPRALIDVTALSAGAYTVLFVQHPGTFVRFVKR